MAAEKARAQGWGTDVSARSAQATHRHHHPVVTALSPPMPVLDIVFPPSAAHSINLRVYKAQRTAYNEVSAG